MSNPELLYVVEHADGSGPMSIALPLDEAREFAMESNLPYKIEAIWNIKPDQDLFVVSETHCRGDIDRNKFTIKFSDLQRAVNQSLSNSEDKASFEEWIESLPEQQGELFGAIQIKWTDNSELGIIKSLLTHAQAGVMGEETDFGIGIAPDDAVQAFFNLSGPITYDNWC